MHYVTETKRMFYLFLFTLFLFPNLVRIRNTDFLGVSQRQLSLSTTHQSTHFELGPAVVVLSQGGQGCLSVPLCWVSDRWTSLGTSVSSLLPDLSLEVLNPSTTKINGNLQQQVLRQRLVMLWISSWILAWNKSLGRVLKGVLKSSMFYRGTHEVCWEKPCCYRPLWRCHHLIADGSITCWSIF